MQKHLHYYLPKSRICNYRLQQYQHLAHVLQPAFSQQRKRILLPGRYKQAYENIKPGLNLD